MGVTAQAGSPPFLARIRARRPSATGRVTASRVFTRFAARRVTNSSPRDSQSLWWRRCCTQRRNGLECVVRIAQPRRNIMMPTGKGNGSGMGVRIAPTTVMIQPPVRMRSFFISISCMLPREWKLNLEFAMAAHSDLTPQRRPPTVTSVMWRGTYHETLQFHRPKSACRADVFSGKRFTNPGCSDRPPEGGEQARALSSRQPARADAGAGARRRLVDLRDHGDLRIP